MRHKILIVVILFINICVINLAYADGIGTVGGMVGVGTGTPDDALDVVGDVDATGCYRTGDLWVIGGVCVSDVRLKDNIVPISDNALAVVKNLKPVRYDWNNTAATVFNERGAGTGFVAQELEAVLPDMVITDAETGYKKVKYTQEITLILLKAIQEQQSMIEKQAQDIAALKMQ